MANQPRPDNPHRMVRVEDELWEAAGRAAAEAGTTRSEVMRAALRALVTVGATMNENPDPGPTNTARKGLE